MPEQPDVQRRILRKAKTPDEFRLYRAALEWDLTDPIVIEGPDDIKSSKTWADRLEPYHHQVRNLITFCRRLPVTLLADDVGLGKTISAGLVLSELIARSRVSKFLVVCPKLLAPQWQAELAEKFAIRSQVAVGRELLRDNRSIGPTGTITTYNSARLYLDSLPKDRFDMVILDEAHKLRNLYGLDQPPQVATRFRKALQEQRFRFVLMLTATPIHNRLWDLYSLVDLLTVARGHTNPFGSEDAFARRFIADPRTHARQLRPEAKEEFRSIVYGYMSRVRRGDANLMFPERVVQMHRVHPSDAELEIIRVIAEPIRRLNRLAQISILQALTSSPAALVAQLRNMARNNTVPESLLHAVERVASAMPLPSKLSGLAALANQLRAQNPDGWRLLVFTGRRETQGLIRDHLEAQGITVGVISGDSALRNQQTVERFRQEPPGVRVVVSTEAGSEGVNLQVANVLVNYDLPWNPMIVEQRIGRVQRLGSVYANVSIFNIILRGTFEEYIVGRLMEKLQMAAHAIGDIEALLQGAAVGDGDDDAASDFEGLILELVLKALEGRDVERATRMAAQSIDNAKNDLAREEANINSLLGRADGAEYVGPRAPNLPPVQRSMDAEAFTLAAFKELGGRVTSQGDGSHVVDSDEGRQRVHFQNEADGFGTSFAPGSPAFQRLVRRIIATGIHDVEDVDRNTLRQSEIIAEEWVSNFGGRLTAVEMMGVRRSFQGQASLRAEAVVAHDRFERLVDVTCSAQDHRTKAGDMGLAPVGRNIEDPSTLGVDLRRLSAAATNDEAIAEFTRFYLERRELETAGAGSDQRKRQKLNDEFTPRVAMTLVGLQGQVFRQVSVRVSYRLDDQAAYEDEITVVPSGGTVVDAPPFGDCAMTMRTVPQTTLGSCSVSQRKALRHLLARSEASGRMALPEHAVHCALSKKRLLRDEVEASDLTGSLVDKHLLKTSAVTGKRGEPAHFGRCQFTDADVLHVELAESKISGRQYRADQSAKSSISGRQGHLTEFVECAQTSEIIARDEAEVCELTGQSVKPGILQACAKSGKHVVPRELSRCSVSGQVALSEYLVKSSVSGLSLMKDLAVQSEGGAWCAANETRLCVWGGRRHHPDDVKTCGLTGVPIHRQFVGESSHARLRPLAEMFDGRVHGDNTSYWPSLAEAVRAVLGGGRCRLHSAVGSPSGEHLAFVVEHRTILGFRTSYAGGIVALPELSTVGSLHRQRTLGSAAAR